MFFKCKCLECDKPLKVLLDFRYVKEKKIELYALKDDGKDPKPTGYFLHLYFQTWPAIPDWRRGYFIMPSIRFDLKSRKR
jgi:hypothetical protein